MSRHATRRRAVLLISAHRNAVIADEIGRAQKLIERNRAPWAEDLQRLLTDAAAAYRAAVVAMEQAREKVVAHPRATGIRLEASRTQADLIDEAEACHPINGTGLSLDGSDFL